MARISSDHSRMTHLRKFPEIMAKKLVRTPYKHNNDFNHDYDHINHDYKHIIDYNYNDFDYNEASNK